VCRRCNSHLGQEVDRLADDRLFLSLREEAGLPVPRKRRVGAEYWDPEAAQSVLVWLQRGGGRFVEQVPTEMDGDSLTIRGETAEEVLEAVRRLSEKRAARGGPIPRWDKPVIRQDATPALIIRPEARPTSFADQLDRLACKIALGYIAAAAGPHVALDERLDPLRTSALDGVAGEATTQRDLLPEGADTVFLPGWNVTFRCARRLTQGCPIRPSCSGARTRASRLPTYSHDLTPSSGHSTRSVSCAMTPGQQCV
jgi:hypothetical protein